MRKILSIAVAIAVLTSFTGCSSKQSGLITDGESVEIYMESDDKESSENYSTEVEKKISELNLNVSVTDNRNNGKESHPVTIIVPDTDIIEPPAEIPNEPVKPVTPHEEHKDDVPNIPDNHPNIAPPELNHDEIDAPAHLIPDTLPEINGDPL